MIVEWEKSLSYDWTHAPALASRHTLLNWARKIKAIGIFASLLFR